MNAEGRPERSSNGPGGQPPSPYEIAVIFLHPACEMTCRFCITENTFSSMSFEQALDLLGLLRRRGFRSVVLGGGEPFDWEHDPVRLAREASERGFWVQVGTNGVSLPEGYAHERSIGRWVLPLDAAEGRLHDSLRILPGGHHRIVGKRLEELREARREVTISTVVNARNVRALPALADFLRAYARRGGLLHAWHLYRFLPVGRGGARFARELEIDEGLYARACAAVKEREEGFRIYRRKDMRHSRTVDFFWYEENALRIGSELW